MKKILHLQLLPLLTGVQNFSLHLLSGLSPDEYEIWVASKPGGEFVDAVLARGFHYLPVASLRREISLWDFVALVKLILLMRCHRFDIVHTNTSKAGILGRLAARLCGVPLIIHTAHGVSFQEGQSRLTQKLFQAAEKFGNQLCDWVVFVNNSDRERCLALGLVSPEKAVSVYNAIPVDYADRLSGIAAARHYDPHKPDFVIGSTLRFSEQKNVIDLVSSACRACSRNPRLRFILLGEGELLGLCRRIVASHRLNGQVLLPGWDLGVDKWLPQFDAFILYSRWEAQPFSIIEAMYSGLAVVGSDIPSIRELVDQDSGWLFPLDDLPPLIDFLAGLPERAKDVFAAGQQAAARIRRLCDYRQMMDGYLRLYERQSDSSEGRL
ncbi:MAG: glycosyltransferase [Candidatus Cloacimonadota bacterium]|jgi:glycosyltransferase involved in cell wall biosynthesis|nr:glycosyltransferase [Candidatus Cloacimonadota bacterium]